MKGKRYFVVIAAVMIIASAINVFGAGPAVKTDRVVYLINGALGDNAFYDSGEAGIKNIEKNYKVQTRTIECNFDAGKFQPALDAAVQYADVIFVISYGFEDQLMAIADKYPNKVFVNIDTIVENPKKTITSVFFLAEQSSYLAGMTAALATMETSLKGVNKDKIIGVIGGDTDPIVSAFVFGYQQGAKAVDKNIKVLTKSLGGAWDDSAKGKQAALQLYDQKADVIYQVAAAAGIGVLQAAAERGLYAIGVDTNQNDLEPGHVIASAVKNVGASIESVFKTIMDGTYKPGVIINADL
ncbi:MAG TPA: BMP family ABC transporter substrate-binding protein, partial [Rectinema sp.]|nr:BMP family ABC transporter substrate-binding protein [Rectinema sp.]HOM92693.1 BMP family ABC transporter substrate-binding protein [Rectinema sp.]